MLDFDDLRTVRKEYMIDHRTVTLRVGVEPAREFAVHEAILREHSPFFQTALDKKWREGRLRHIDLPQDNGDVVGAYVHWLYFAKIASKPVSPPQLPMDDGEYQFLMDLYCFGTKVMADTFCNDVIDALALKSDEIAKDGTRTFPSHGAIMSLYNGTPQGSPARKFVVEMYVEFGTEHWVPEEPEYSHSEFLTDLVRLFLRNTQAGLKHKQLNFPRRHKWHKHSSSHEFLQPATSRDDLEIRQAD